MPSKFSEVDQFAAAAHSVWLNNTGTIPPNTFMPIPSGLSSGVKMSNQPIKWLADKNAATPGSAVRTQGPNGVETLLSPSDADATFPKVERGVVAGVTYPDGRSFYRQGYTTPAVLTHERIHQGQSALPNQPDAADVRSIFKDQQLGYNQRDERPAYAFMDYSPSNQASYNKYIDLIRRTNPGGGSQTLEKSTPVKYQMDYIKSSPLKMPVPTGLR